MESPLELFVWRVSNYSDLSGRGGLQAEGRWHTRGQLIVYCSETVACAREEVRVHLTVPFFLLPANYKILKIRVPKNVRVVSRPESELPTDWRTSYDFTQPIGDEWLRGVGSPMLKVPSAICAGISNFLINPVHRMSDFIQIVSETPIDEFEVT